jgi:hypothetical protein
MGFVILCNNKYAFAPPRRLGEAHQNLRLLVPDDVRRVGPDGPGKVYDLLCSDEGGGIVRRAHNPETRAAARSFLRS